MEIEDLSIQVLFLIFQKVDFDQLENLFLVSRPLFEIITLNEKFWQYKYLQEYVPPKKIPLFWEEAYHQIYFAQVLGFGTNYGEIFGIYKSNQPEPEVISGLKNVKDISVGVTHNLALTYDGFVFAFGYNNYGELGLKGGSFRSPTLIPNLPKIRDISAGNNYSLALTNEGDVYSFGLNSSGQLGLGDKQNRSIPTLIPNLPKIVAISTGKSNPTNDRSRSLILSDDGQVFTFGFDVSEQQPVWGRSESWFQPIPIPVQVPEKIKAISAGSHYSLMLSEGGSVYIVGWNDYGEMGLGNPAARRRPQKIPFLQEKIKTISAGFSHILLLDISGMVYGFGLNTEGQLGIESLGGAYVPVKIPFPEKIKDISAGYGYSLVLSETGKVYVFGANDSGQLGLGIEDKKIRIPRIIQSIPKVTKIATGYRHALILAEPFALNETIEVLLDRNLIQSSEYKYPTSETTIFSEPLAVFELTDIENNTYWAKMEYDPETKEII